MIWRLLAIVIRLGIGLVLFSASLWLLIALVRTTASRQALVSLGALLAALWLFWTKLPDWLQELIRALWKRTDSSED
jgi:undecaprenyl pyrophosphate phosphatase UppP